MPDPEHKVIYRAVADFSNVAAEAAKARAEIQALKDAEGKSNAASLQGITDLAKAHERKNVAIREERAEEDKARQSIAQSTAAALAHAKEVERQAEAIRSVADAHDAHRAALARPVAASDAEAIRQHQRAIEQDGRSAQQTTKDLDALARAYQAQVGAAQQAARQPERPPARRAVQLPPQRRPGDEGPTERIPASVINDVVTQTARAFQGRADDRVVEHPDIVRQRAQGAAAITAAEREVEAARTRVASASVSEQTAELNLSSARRRSIATAATLQKADETLQQLRASSASGFTVQRAEEKYATALERDAIAVARLQEAELRVQRARLSGERAIEKQADAEAHLATVRAHAQQALAAVISRVETETAGGVHLPVNFNLRGKEKLLSDIVALAKAASQRFDSEFPPFSGKLKLPTDTPFLSGVESAAKTAAKTLTELFTLPTHAEQRGAAAAQTTARDEGAKQVAEAEDVLTAARRRAETALLRVRAAVLNYDRAEKAFGETSRQARVAEIQLESARLGGAKAVADVSKATAELAFVHRTVDKAIADAAKTARNTGTAWQILGRAGKDLGLTVEETAKNVERGIRGAFASLGDGATVAEKFQAVVQGTVKGLSNAGSGFSGFTGLLKSGFGVLEAVGGAFQFMDRMILPIAAWGSLIGPAIGLIMALGAAVLGLGGALGSLGGSVAALPGLLAAGATGFAALLVSISPLIEAVKAYAAVSDAARAAAFDPATTQQQVQKQQALQSAIWGVAAAMVGERNANYDLTKANESVLSAENSLAEARETALRQLQDLREAVTNGALDERGATLDLAQAELAYRKALADPTKTLLDREQALQAVQEAQVRLNDVQKQNLRNQDDLAEANAKGVNGSDQVVSAQQALESALHGVAVAQEQQAAASQASIKATWALQAAQVAAAQPASSLLAAQTKLKVILDELSPSALKIYQAFAGMPGLWRSLSKQVQESFFSQFAGQAHQIVGLLPQLTTLLVDAGTALGGVVSRGLAMVSSGPWTRDFATGAKANAVVLTNLGDAGLSVLDAFRNIAIAAIPFTTWVSAGIAKAADEFDRWSASTRKSGNLADFLHRLEPRLHIVGDIIKNIFETIGRFGSAAAPFNDWLLNGLDRMTKRWADFAQSSKQAGSGFKTALQDMEPVLTAFGDLVHTLAAGLVTLGSDPQNLKNTTELLNTLTNDLLPKLIDWIHQLEHSSAIHDIAQTLKLLFDAINTFLNSGGGGSIVAFFSTISGLLTIISTLHLAPVLGVLGVGFGVLAGLKFLGLFKLARMLSKIPLFAGLVSKLGGALLKLPGISKLADLLGLSGKGASSAAALLDASAEALTGSATALDGAALALKEAAGFLSGTLRNPREPIPGTAPKGEPVPGAAPGTRASGEAAPGEAAPAAASASKTFFSTLGRIASSALFSFFGSQIAQQVTGNNPDTITITRGDGSTVTGTKQTLGSVLSSVFGGAAAGALAGGPAGAAVGAGVGLANVALSNPVSVIPGRAISEAQSRAQDAEINRELANDANSPLNRLLQGLSGRPVTTTVPGEAVPAPGKVTNSLIDSVAAAVKAAGIAASKALPRSGFFAGIVAGTERTLRGDVASTVHGLDRLFQAARVPPAVLRAVQPGVATVVHGLDRLFAAATVPPSVVRAVQPGITTVQRGLDRLFAAATVPPAVVRAVQPGISNVITGIQKLLHQSTLTPAQLKALQPGVSSVVNGLEKLFQQSTVPPTVLKAVEPRVQAVINGLNDLFEPIPNSVLKAIRARAQAVVDSIAALFTPASVRSAVSGGVASAASLPGRAGGGSLPEGLSTVGEVGMEFAFKRGSQVDIIPAPTTLPSFQFGTDFGAELLRQPPFVPATSFPATQTTEIHAPGITIGRLEINNPKPEKAGDSLYRALQKVNYFAGKG